MSVLESLQRLKSSELVDEDGERVAPQFVAGYAEADIAAIEESLGARLPDDLRELLAHSAGIEGLLGQIAFNGCDGFEYEEIFPHGLPIATDGFGNAWVVDVIPRRETRAQIYFACHDAPVILFQCDGVATFLDELVRMHTPPHASLINDVHDDRLFDVWKRNPQMLARDDALRSNDAAVRAFADTLDDRYWLIDLRDAPPGMGFSWGRHGANTEVRRHGEQRLFAYAKPKPKPGLLSRIFRV